MTKQELLTKLDRIAMKHERQAADRDSDWHDGYASAMKDAMAYIEELED